MKKSKKAEKNQIVMVSPQQFTKNFFKFTISSTEDNATFFVQNLKDFPIKTYELKLTISDVEQMEEFENFKFKNMEKFCNVIRKCINADKYEIIIGNDENFLRFRIKSELFDNDQVEFKIPEKGVDLNIKSEIDALKVNFSEINKIIGDNRDFFYEKVKTKEEYAKNSFVGTSILNNEEKILISKFIDPHKKIKFNLLYSSSKDSFGSTYFHDYCDDAHPILIIIYDNSSRKFGGYSTQSFRQPTNGYYNSRAPDSFLFNLSNKQKFELSDPNSLNAIYRYNSYGPCFGYNSSGTSYYDLYVPNNCNSSSCYCYKGTYNTGSYNLLGGSGQTSFTVSYIEAYQVIFE